MKDYYESLYKANRTHFGLSPSPLALLLIQQCRSGTLLDLGAGQGRDALYFASKGLRVTAIDISPTAVKGLLEEAEKAKIAIDAREGDMHDLPQEQYDAVFSDFALQMIAPNERKEYIERLKSAYPHAVHAHVVPITSACFGSEFIFADHLLTEAYGDWDILFSEEAWTIAPAPNRNGEPYLVREARIIAKNKRS